MNKEQLIKAYKQKKKLKYIFFWSDKPRIPRTIDKSCLSQWYPASFVMDGITYPTAEHYMMAEKARLFGDDEMLQRILRAGNPGAAKKFGRMVADFDLDVWNENRMKIVVQGSFAKFSQNEPLAQFLCQTKKRILVEASPHDKIWGVGLSEDDKAIYNPLLWDGLNLLGFALMEARDELLGAR